MVTPLCRVLEFSEEGWLLPVQDCSTGTADLLPPCHHILMRAFMLNNTHVWYLTLFKVFSLIWSHWIILEPWEASRHAHIWKHLRLELQPESDTTERLDFHFPLSCIGEGNGNSLQCSCLENPRDGEPGGLPSIGSHRVEHDWSDLAAAEANLDSIFKSRDITLPTKVRLVKAMVFPVVMYGCESWTVKKAER